MRLLGYLGFAFLVFPTAAPAEPPTLDPDQLPKLQALIRPNERETAWLQIPWRSDLWEARRLAAREGKPILLWEMDGHPLGCV